MSIYLHNIKPAKGSKRKAKRIGRGNASGHGTYSTRGQKGQRARSGGRKGLKRMGLRRLVLSIPKKRGFKSTKEKSFAVNLGDLEKILKADEIVDLKKLVSLGVIDQSVRNVKILGDGEFKKVVTIRGLKVSESAKQKIIAAGGKVE